MLEQFRALNQKERAERYRQRALIAVEIAGRSMDKRIRDQFLIIADNWRHLASLVELLTGADPKLTDIDISDGASDDLRR